MKVLLSDRDAASAAALRGSLQAWGHDVVSAPELPEIWNVLLDSSAPVIAIIDCMHDELGGLDVFRNIRATIKHCGVYLILLTSRVDAPFLDEALEAGANSYLARPANATDLRICVEGGRRLLELEQALTLQSTRDTLTGLHNRHAIVEHLGKESIRCQRERSPLSIIYTDLDRLQDVNERYGHLVGDVVLREVGRRLGMVLRSYDHLGRYGDDELITILPNCNTAGALEVAERARMSVAMYPVNAITTQLLASVTSVTATLSGKTDVPPQTLLQLAETALHRAKDEGRNRVGLANLYCSML